MIHVYFVDIKFIIFLGKSRLAMTKKLLKQAAHNSSSSASATSTSSSIVTASTASSSSATTTTANSERVIPSGKQAATCESVESHLGKICAEGAVSQLLVAEESETLKNSRKWPLSQRYFEYIMYLAKFPKLISSDKAKLQSKIEDILGYEDFKTLQISDLNFSRSSGSPILDSYSINHGISLK